MIRVAICDDHRLFADAVGAALRPRDIEAIVVEPTVEACRAAAEQAPFDVWVVDRHLPDIDGLDLIAELRSSWPDVPVLVLSGSAEPDLFDEVRRFGAHGFASKDISIDRLANAIWRVHAGELVEARVVGPRPTGIAELARRITPKEKAVLQCLVDGKDTAVLAAELSISYATARTHIQNLLTKLGVHSKLELVSLAVSHRLLPPVRRDRTA